MKDKTTHTPGPWIRGVGDEGTCSVYASFRGMRVVVAATENFRLPIAEQKANARLIAAAPELLAALKALRQNGTLAQRMTPADALALADAAIAKAER